MRHRDQRPLPPHRRAGRRPRRDPLDDRLVQRARPGELFHAHWLPLPRLSQRRGMGELRPRHRKRKPPRFRCPPKRRLCGTPRGRRHLEQRIPPRHPSGLDDRCRQRRGHPQYQSLGTPPKSAPPARFCPKDRPPICADIQRGLAGRIRDRQLRTRLPDAIGSSRTLRYPRRIRTHQKALRHRLPGRHHRRLRSPVPPRPTPRRKGHPIRRTHLPPRKNRRWPSPKPVGPDTGTSRTDTPTWPSRSTGRSPAC